MGDKIEMPSWDELGRDECRLRNPLIPSGELAGMSGEEVSWLVEGLLPAESVVLLAAPPGTYKTWFALCLARSVALGLPFAGRATRQAPVYYIDRENPKPLLCGRVRRVGAAERLKFWPLWSWPPPHPAGSALYGSLAGEGALIVFDSLVRFHKAEENSSTEMAAVMGEMKALAGRGGTVLILHHKGKNESDYRGSSEILAGVQVAYSMKKSAYDPAVVEVKSVKNHYAPECSMAFRFVEESPEGRVRFEAEDIASSAGEDSPWERVRAALEGGERSFEELREATDIPFKKLQGLLIIKEHSGKVVSRRVEHGRKLYSLPGMTAAWQLSPS